MTPRERILAVLNHQQPDQLPVDFGGTAVTTITAQAYDALRDTLGLPPSQADILSFYGLTVKIEDDMLEYFSSDTRAVFPRHASDWAFSPQPDGEYDTFVDEWGITFRKPRDGGFYFDLCRHPLAGFDGVAAIESYPLPPANDPYRIAGLREQCLAFREQGYPVIFGHTIGNGIMQSGARLCGYEEYFTKMLTEPAAIDRLSERILESKMAFFEMVLEQLGDVIDVVFEMDDLGTQQNLLISPRAYRKRIKPFHAELFAYIKQKTPHIKIFFHSCGSIAGFIPDLIEMGIDALNPVQISAKGMEPEYLKKEFGHDITFWGGGVDTQNILPTGTPQQVKDDVRKRVSSLMKDAGFVFATVHNIQPDVPPENILAMFEALEEFR